MKEKHLFFSPKIIQTLALPEEEALHAIRVLRLKEGDEIWVTNGQGTFYNCLITQTGTSKKPHCSLKITEETIWQQPWASKIHIALAPTKMMERMEWMTEKITEIGINSLSFLESSNSERKKIRLDRLQRIALSATKQSHKAQIPILQEQQNFRQFITQPFEGEKFIAHCYPQKVIQSQQPKQFLYDLISPQKDSIVLIGPEGDFSIEEIKLAEASGFISVSLGTSRLRTETAALIAAQLMNLKKSHNL